MVNTFSKGYDWTEKKVLAFATSDGCPIGKTAEKFKPFVQGTEAADAVLVKSLMNLRHGFKIISIRYLLLKYK